MSALQKGEIVLITGATGWVGSHIANEALSAGLNIKLAVRDEAKAKDVVDALEKLHGSGHIELVTIKDFSKDGAYDEAIQGVQGVVHAATDVSFSANPEELIPPVLKSYNLLLEAANLQNKVRRVVITSSSIAVGYLDTKGEEKRHFDVNTWNDEALDQIKTSPNPVNVYAASKVLSEREAWKYLKIKKPSFTISSVNPSVVIGASVPGYKFNSSGKWLIDAAEGRDSVLEGFSPGHHIDVDDTAKLHILALTNPDIKSERILAIGSKFSFNSLLDTIKEIKPNAPTQAKKDGASDLSNVTVDNARANELLKQQGGLRDFKYSIRGNVQAL